MTIGNLIAQFSAKELVPVDVNDVLQALRERGIRDEVYFWYADIESEHLRGLMVRSVPWEYPNADGDEQPVTDIYTAKDMPTDWKRLVECKELLHVLDSEKAKARTEAEIDRLTAEIVLPPELQNAHQDGHATIIDRVAITQAVAILFPLATRTLFADPLKEGKITLDDIARIVDVPRRYVGHVMHPSWLELHEILLRT